MAVFTRLTSQTRNPRVVNERNSFGQLTSPKICAVQHLFLRRQESVRGASVIQGSPEGPKALRPQSGCRSERRVGDRASLGPVMPKGTPQNPEISDMVRDKV